MRLMKSALGVVLMIGLSFTLTGCDGGEEGGGDANANGSGNDNQAAAPGAIALTGENTTITFVGEKPSGDTHDGGFEKLTGSLNFDAENLTTCSLQVTIDMNSLWSDGGSRLTGHLKDPDFFEVAMYPESKFSSTSFEKADDGKFNVTGEFTLHGQTNTVTLPVTITESDSSLTLEGDFVVLRGDYGMDYDVSKVLNEVPVTVKVEASKSGE